MKSIFMTQIKQTGKPRCKRTADFALSFPKGFVGRLVRIKNEEINLRINENIFKTQDN